MTDPEQPTSGPDLSANVERWRGFAERYDRYRPETPPVLLELLSRLTGGGPLTLVVDLGCGTGLSTRPWASRAERVLGVDPSEDMIAHARAVTAEANVAYQLGHSHEANLPDGGADVVTCAQSLHWMEPASTFREVGRLLRPGGVFAAYNFNWPPVTPRWEMAAAFDALKRRGLPLARAHGVTDGIRRWDADGHVGRMRDSGAFRFVKEIAVHQEKILDADQAVGLTTTIGAVANMLKRGLSEERIGLDAFRSAARSLLGEKPRPWLFTYRVWLGCGR